MDSEVFIGQMFRVNIENKERAEHYSLTTFRSR